MARKKKKSESRQATEFAIVLFVAACLIAGWMYYRGAPSAAYVGGGGMTVLLVALVSKPLWLVVFRLWMKLGEAMGFVMTRVILSAFFWGFLTPIALVVRLVGKNPLDVKFGDGKSSYWIDKESAERTVERYSKLY